jgi:hypothetical protein
MIACKSLSGEKNHEMASIEGPIVGCVGNINRSYDWVLIKKMAEALPAATIVFLGNVTERTPEIEDIRQKKNVIFMGWRDPENLAEYVSSFDVCLNPLTVNEINNRRCPLRLYTYLCTPKPVVSTCIESAEDLSDHILIGKTHDDCISLVKDAVEGRTKVDVRKREEFMLTQTWNHRARDLMDHVDKVVFGV